MLLCWNDLRVRGKGVSLGEYGVKTHPAWSVANGATGAVGTQMIECLEERNFPVGKIKYLASARSAGQIMEFKGKGVLVEELSHDSFEGIDIALFSAGGDRSRDFCPSAARAGAVVTRPLPDRVIAAGVDPSRVVCVENSTGLQLLSVKLPENDPG